MQPVLRELSGPALLGRRRTRSVDGGLGRALLSTATTVVLARQASADGAMRSTAEAGITLATAIMYLRILASWHSLT